MKYIVNKFIILLLIGLFAANMFFYTKTIAMGDEMVDLERKTKMLKAENSELEKQLSAYNSLENLEKLAQHLGFRDKPSVLYSENSQVAAR